MGGVLQFTLGLEVSDFLSKAGISSTAITGLAGAGEMLHKAMEKVFQSFEQGAALEHLSKRTGESAGKLYQLQEAMKACGVSAESLPQMLFQMQKALGGVSEMGEDTAGVFHKLHLSIGDLKSAGPAEALGHILERLSKLSPDSAAKASSMIFGRMGAGQAVQMSRSPNEFREAFADAGRQASIFKRAVAAFAEIARTIGAIKREITGFWAGIAEGAAPAVQSILNWLRKINLTGLGQQIGTWIRALTESFSSGGFVELISLSLQAGFEQGGFYGMKFIATFAAGLAAALPEAIAAGFQASAGILESFGEGLYKTLYSAEMRIAGKAIANLSDPNYRGKLSPEERASRIKQYQGILDSAEQNFNDQVAGGRERRGALIASATRNIGAAMREGMAGAGATWASFGPAPTEQSSALQAKINQILSRLGRTSAAGAGAVGTEDIDFGHGLTHRTEGNVFEKMGFVMGGGGGPMHDVARNTANPVDVLNRILGAVTGNPDSTAGSPGGVHQPL